MKVIISRVGCALVALLVTAGCVREPTGLTSTDQPGRIVVGFAGPTTSLPRDAYQVEDAHIAADTLTLRITHSGGCAEHEFGLVASNIWLESFPVQTSVLLLHDAKGDPCRALLERTLRFDLTPLREAFAASYGTPRGTITINLENPNGAAGAPLRRLTYTF